jgi:hypothetical protein
MLRGWEDEFNVNLKTRRGVEFDVGNCKTLRSSRGRASITLRAY